MVAFIYRTSIRYSPMSASASHKTLIALDMNELICSSVPSDYSNFGGVVTTSDDIRGRGS